MTTFIKILIISYLGMLINAFFSGLITNEIYRYFYGIVLITINRFWLMFLSVAASYYLVTFFVGNEKNIHLLIMYVLCIIFLLLLSFTHLRPFSKEWLYPSGLWYVGYATVTCLIYMIALKFKWI